MSSSMTNPSAIGPGEYYHQGEQTGSQSPEGSYQSPATVSPNAPSHAMNWFDEHPVVATVLWALGTEVKNYASHKLRETQKTLFRRNNRFMETISDTFGHKQSHSHSNSHSNSHSHSTTSSTTTRKTTGHLLYSTATAETSNENLNRNGNANGNGSGVVLNRYHTYREDRTSSSGSASGSDCHSPCAEGTTSPYGFFVAITPSEEVF